MYQDREPALTSPGAPTTLTTGQASNVPGLAPQATGPGPTQTSPAAGPLTPILRTASPPPRVASPAHDPANTSTEGPARVWSVATHSEHLAHHDPTRSSLPRRRSTFTDRGPYDHDTSAFGAPLPALPERPHSSPPGAMSGLDWIVPEKPLREKSVEDRLKPTLITAISERDKCVQKAKIHGWTLNVAIGLQVLLGALTTGLSAASTSARQTSINTAILGGLSTLCASYLARARGSNEPALSTGRAKDLDQFIRECQAFMMDNGHLVSREFDARIEALRQRFEELLGNVNQERKLSSPV